MALIAPSILASDFANLQKEIEMINESEADWIHVDVMDGVFVPNISFGVPVCKSVQKHAKKPLDVHLMIVNPEKYVSAFKDAGAEIISVHYEACPHLHRNLQQLHDLGVKAAIAINPHTPVELLEDILEMTDMVLIMSVNPGFGGQKFIERTYSRIEKLKGMITRQGTDTLIEIDGGVNQENAGSLINAGADVLVAGSFVFRSSDPKNTISNLKNV